MSHDRPNHYRTLQVQPGAHPEVIATSYRRLMGRLRNHPGPVFDRETAEQLNEAYNVLKDKNRRLAYDTQRMALRRPDEDPAQPFTETNPAVLGHCPFCGEKAPTIIGATTRCNSCEAPLAPVIAAGPLSMPYRGRAHARIPQSSFARLHLESAGPVYNAKMRDLSASGLSLFCGKAPVDGSSLRVILPKLDAVARVIRVRPHGPVTIVHARMLTACYMNRAGVFVSGVI